MTGLAAEIEACERAVWQALATGDAAADRALLSADFLGVYPDGFAGPVKHAAQLASGATVTRFELTQVQVRPLGADHALIVYCAVFLRPGQEEEERMYVSSIWQRQSPGWRNIFSQDTPATGERLP